MYYDRTPVSEGIDNNKANTSKDYVICHYWYFLDKEFKFKSSVCNGCYGVLTISVGVDNIENNILNILINISNINGVDCRCIICGVSKNEAIDLLKTANSS